MINRRFGPFNLGDVLIAAVIAAFTFLFCYDAADWKRPELKTIARDVWFEADTDRVLGIESVGGKDYDRTLMHPIYPFIARPIVGAMTPFLPKSDEHDPVSQDHNAVRFFHSGVAVIWVTAFYFLLRFFGCRRFDSVVFTGVLASSATALIWLPAVETFVMGGITMYGAYALAAMSQPARVRDHVIVGVATLGVTVTNWMAGIFASVASLPFGKLARTLLISLAVTAVFAVATRFVFPGSQVMLRDSGAEWAWVFTPESEGGAGVSRVFFFSSMIAPEIRFIDNYKCANFPFMSFQAGGLFSGTKWSWIGTPAWAVLLILGAWALFRNRKGRLQSVLILTILYQLLLHIVYGRETFLYGPHFLPALVAATALLTLTPLRRLAIVLGVVLCAANVGNNLAQYNWAKSYVRRASEIAWMQKRDLLKPSRPMRTRDDTWDFRIWKEF